jgi:dienelactone hydrolase
MTPQFTLLIAAPTLGAIALYCGRKSFPVVGFTMRPGLPYTAAAAGVVGLLFYILSLIPGYSPPKVSGPFGYGVVQLDPRLYELKGAEYRAPVVELHYPVTPEGDTRKFPIILFFSGWPGGGTEINLVHELASRGFALATARYPPLLAGLSAAQLGQRNADLQHELDFSSEEAFREAVAFADQRARDRAGDASAILDALIRLKARGDNDVFARLDPDNTGVIGFSFGGSIAAQARVQDIRFKAAINLDGWHFADAVSGVKPPYLYILCDQTRYPSVEEIAPSAPPNSRGEALLNKREFDETLAAMSHIGGFLVFVAGAHHFNLSDQAFQGSLLRRLLTGTVLHRPGGLGPIDPERGYEIVAAYTTAFFESSLKGQRSPLLDGTVAPFPEAPLQTWTAEPN